MNHAKPFLKWAGGKRQLLNEIEKNLPPDISKTRQIDLYIEPFVGGASVLFHLSPKKSIISDLHTELIDFYTAIKNNKSQEIYNFMSEHENDEKTYYRVRDDFEINDYLDNAKRFYYLRKTCFRGMMRYNKKGEFNIPYGKYKTCNYEDLLKKEYSNVLKNTEIFNKSFEYVFENYNSKDNFMFLDPPYDSQFTDYGYCKFGKEEHIKLYECFKSTNIRCLMVIGKTDFIKELYKDYIVEEYDKKYRFKLYGGRVGDEIDNKHLIICNYKI